VCPSKRQGWEEDVMENLKKLKVKNWKEAAKDRRTWRDLAEKAKTHKGLQCQMMIMMMCLSKGIKTECWDSPGKVTIFCTG
jgi:hypothetical protein